jgi:hypothetical protein
MFTTQTALQNHLKYCDFNERVDLPSETNSILKFKNFENTLKLPFIIYADFESINVPIQSCKQDPTTSFTNATHSHKAYSIAYVKICTFNNSMNDFQLYRGENPAKWFMVQLKNEADIIYNQIRSNFNKECDLLTEEELKNHENLEKCPSCNLKFSLENYKVKHHCHFTGQFLRSLCNNCNLKCKYSKGNKIPVMLNVAIHYRQLEILQGG